MSLYHTIIEINQRWRMFTPELTEFAFILGAMKAGTSTLYSYLVQHPNVCECVRKEPHFWSRVQAPDNLNEYYRMWLPRPGRRQIALEASSSYTRTPLNPNVAERLRQLPGRKHFLYLVRNPIDRIESHVAHNIGKGRLSVEDAMRLKDLSHYVSVSKYASQIEKYTAAFPETPIKILDLDQLKADPLSVVRDACGALDIDPEFQFRSIPPKNMRKTDHGAKTFRLRDDMAAELRTLLAEDMRRFEQISGFDVTRWGFGSG